jgi:hypothetical protein
MSQTEDYYGSLVKSTTGAAAQATDTPVGKSLIESYYGAGVPGSQEVMVPAASPIELPPGPDYREIPMPADGINPDRGEQPIRQTPLQKNVVKTVESGVEFVAENLDRLFRPAVNAAYVPTAMLAGGHPEERFDWGKSDLGGLANVPFVGELARGVAMTAQAAGRGLVHPLSVQHPGNQATDSVTGAELYTMAMFQQQLQKHPELLEKHPIEIFAAGLALELYSPSVLKYLRPGYISNLLRHYNAANVGADAVSAERALIALGKSSEVQSGVDKVLLEMEAENRAREVARRTALEASRKTPGNFFENDTIGGALDEVLNPGKLYAGAKGAVSNAIGATAEAVANAAGKVPYFNPTATLARETEAAKAAMAKMPAGWAPAATRAGRAEQGIQHLGALVIGEGDLGKLLLKEPIVLGTGHVAPWLNKIGLHAIDVAVDGLEKQGSYGEAAKLATTYALSHINPLGIVPQGWIDAIGRVGESVGNLAQQGAQIGARIINPVHGHAEVDASMDRFIRLGKVREESATAVSNSYAYLQEQGAEALKMSKESFAEAVARCESKEFYAQADPIVQKTWDMGKSVNAETTNWLNANGFDRKLFEETDTQNYFMHMVSDKGKEWIKEGQRLGKIASGDQTIAQRDFMRQFSSFDRLGAERKLIMGDGTAYGINQELRAKYGIPFDFFKLDFAEILAYRTKVAARIFTNKEFTEAAKNWSIAKRTGWNYEPTPEGMVGKRVVENNGRIERVFVQQDKIDEVSKALRSDIVKEYRDARTDLLREHRTAIAQRAADKSARIAAKTPPGLENEMQLEGAFGKHDEPRTIITSGGEGREGPVGGRTNSLAGTMEVPKDPNITKVSDIFPEAEGAPGAKQTLTQTAAATMPKPPSPKVVRKSLAQYDPARPVQAQLKSLRENMAKDVRASWTKFLDDAKKQGWARPANDVPKIMPGGKDAEWTASQNPAFRGYAFPKDITTLLDHATMPESNMLFDEKFLRTTGAAWDRFAGWFRAQALLTPRYHIRNIAGNEYNKLLFTGMNSSNILAYIQSHALSWASSMGRTDLKLTTPGFTGTLGELDTILRERGALGQTILGAENNPLTVDLGMGKLFSKNRWLATTVEDESRRQMIIHQLQRGRSLPGAIDDMFTTCFDYLRRSNVERHMARATFFWGWTRRNVPYQLQMFLEHPWRQTVVPTIVRNIREYWGRAYPQDRGEGDRLSQYMIDKMGVKVKRGDNGVSDMVLLGEWMPLENANIVLGFVSGLADGEYAAAGDELAGQLFAMGTQPFKALIEAKFNFDTFFSNTIDKVMQQHPESGMRQPATMLGVPMTAREKHLAKVFTLAKWADDLGEISGSDAYRHKDWFIRTLKACGVSVQELDIQQEGKREQLKRKGLLAETKRELGVNETRRAFNKEKPGTTTPTLEWLRSNVDQARDIVHDSTIRRPW